MKYTTYSTSIQPLLDYFDRFFPLNDHDKDLVMDKFHPLPLGTDIFVFGRDKIKYRTVADYRIRK
jgi:hypothetical protein